MRRLLLVIGILLAGSQVAFPQTPPSPSPDQPGTGRIRGRVVATDTGAPLRGVRLLAFIAEGGPPRETVTDADGRYELGQLPAGEFVVSATLDGYLGVVYGQRRFLGDPEPITVAPGQTVERIDMSLPRAGVIVVNLTDETGEPLAGAQVDIQQYRHGADGQRRLASAPTGVRGPLSRTDDRGELRVFGLQPGEYAIRATLRTLQTGSAALTRDRSDGFSTTYYPGTTRVADAQLVTIGIGDERTVQFAMVPSRLHRVTGTIVTSDGQPVTGMDLQLAPAEGESGITYGVGTAAADGTFAIGGVPDGNYTLQVRQNMRPSPEALRAGQGLSLFERARGEFASVPLTVRGGDVTGLRIVTSRGATISGRVIVEGVSPLPSKLELQVFVLPPGLAGGGWAFAGSSVYDAPPQASVATDGRFQIAGASGRVQLDAGAAGLVVKSVTLDGRDITDEALDLTGTHTVSGVVITLTDKMTSIAGQVRSRDGQPQRNSVVILLPAEAGTLRPIYTSRGGANGRFQFERVRPGRYVAAAVEWIEPGAYLTPEFQERLRRGAREFSIVEGQNLTLDLTLTPGL